MPNRTKLGPPPETMTWGKASPVFIVAGTFDILRLMCQQLWFFGPALAALYCANKVGDVWVVGGLLTKACVAGAAVAGAYSLPVLATLGTVLAIAVGFMGWLVVGLILVMSNRRLFSENSANIAWMGFSLLISEIPFVGTLPALSGTLFKMYRTQIHKEKAALAEYKKRAEEERVQERQRQSAELAQMRTVQMEQQQAANDEEYAETEAANDEAYAEQEAVEEERRVQTEAANDESYIPEKKYGT